ncbi:MAG: toxin-antitoxin system protein [Streptococcus sp.]|jgi:hypothetical protein|nr:toxin-antitoxin system protein [Streptococcus sp.]MBF1711880.1 toxin-antitoxin system protein [Streptococcus sp.]
MSTISLRLNKEEERLFKNYADFTGEGLTTLLKKALTEKIEEEYDLQAVKEYESAKAKGEVILVDHEEFWGDL